MIAAMALLAKKIGAACLAPTPGQSQTPPRLHVTPDGVMLRDGMAIEIICTECGGTDVVRDAWAAWDAGRQEWVLANVFDDGFCRTCERAVTLAERTLQRVIVSGR